MMLRQIMGGAPNQSPAEILSSAVTLVVLLPICFVGVMLAVWIYGQWEQRKNRHE